MTYNVFSGTLNPTHSLTHAGNIMWRDGGMRSIECPLIVAFDNTLLQVTRTRTVATAHLPSSNIRDHTHRKARLPRQGH